MMRKLGFVEWLVMVFIVIGALSWGLIGLFDLNLVEVFFQPTSVYTRGIYLLIGLAGLYEIIALAASDKNR